MILFLSGYLAVGGFALMLMAHLHALVPSLLLNLIFGAIMAATTVQLLTSLQQCVANHFLGRMLATYTAIQALARVVGMGVASIAVFPIGVMWFLMCNGALYLLGSGLAWILLTGDDDSGTPKSEKTHRTHQKPNLLELSFRTPQTISTYGTTLSRMDAYKQNFR